MRSIEAILFDLDGTLIDSKRDIALSVHHVQKKYGRPLSPDDEIARFIGDGVGKLIERAIGIRPASEMEEAVALFKAYYRRHALDHTRIYPGVLPALKRLRQKKMAVVTNKPTRISKWMIRRLGLTRFFPVVVGGDSVKFKKPDPEGLLQAMDRLGIDRTRSVLMVGDSAQDIIAGRRAGMWTCGWVSNIGDPMLLRKARPDFTVNSLLDLPRILG